MSDYILASGTRLTRENQMDRIKQDFHSIRIITLEGLGIGMVKLVKKSDAWKIVQIQLLPEYQNHGIGRRLIGSIQSDAGIYGVPLYLSVLKVNPAKQFYEKLGFCVHSEKNKSFEMRYFPKPATIQH